MTSAETCFRDDDPVAILFAPQALLIIDVFRALGDFEEHYDVTTLDRLEERLTLPMGRDGAKAVVSDALLLAFGLRRERVRPIAFAPLHSRRGSVDEYRLLSLISATFWHDFVVAAEAATALDVGRSQAIVSLAFDIARRLENAGIKLDAPDTRLFGPVISPSPVEVDREVRPSPLKLGLDR
jgi:hypothetical protein